MGSVIRKSLLVKKTVQGSQKGPKNGIHPWESHVNSSYPQEKDDLRAAFIP